MTDTADHTTKSEAKSGKGRRLSVFHLIVGAVVLGVAVGLFLGELVAGCSWKLALELG